MKKDNKIPVKNYISVVVMFLIIMSLTLFLAECYKKYNNYKLNIPVISGKIQEITLKEFDNYTIGHGSYYLYIGKSNNGDCRELEKYLLDVLKEKNIINDTVYLNMTNESKRNLKNKIEEIFNEEIKIDYPVFLIIEDNKIIKKSNKELDIESLKEMLDEE